MTWFSLVGLGLDAIGSDESSDGADAETNVLHQEEIGLLHVDALSKTEKGREGIKRGA